MKIKMKRFGFFLLGVIATLAVGSFVLGVLGYLLAKNSPESTDSSPHSSSVKTSRNTFESSYEQQAFIKVQLSQKNSGQTAESNQTFS
ncbi:hypothetical protein P7H74_11640 [Enterococcus devriesei]|uniref:hypothetical protein n=1 Tax=Enterococcus devriesei TaxID=319970 RepID=UPI0028908AE1|nr:hypothetical protein [Enterococcus devriesei]MDT2822394.1 hypothetical protein [Enterococcus devriesei]